MSDCTERKGKKRTRNEQDYQRNKIKYSRVHGEAYCNYKGKAVPAITTGEACKCMRKCFEIISDDDKIDILRKFLDLSNKNAQDMFLQGLIIAEKVKRRRVKDKEPVKNNTFTYHVMIGSSRSEVCRQAFISLYAITAERVKRIRNLLLKGETPKDMRGKARSANAMPAEEVLKIIHHIESFPKHESHYSSRPVMYLHQELSVKKMHDLFKEKFPNSKVKYEFYNKIFNENFNLRFGRPAVDTCCECEGLMLKIRSNTLNDSAKKVAAAEYAVHKQRANKFYTALREAKEAMVKDDTLALCFDYMQNVQLPAVPVQELFYLRQLTVSVFCIFNLKTGKSVIYIYHEGNAKKGPNEVCTLISKYLTVYVDEKIKNLLLFSDNCPGQNKNHPIVRMNMALIETQRFDTIEHYYPFRGHSFLPCDRVFGVIKRSLKKKERIYSINQLVEYIIHSSAKFDFIVEVIKGDDIIEFKKWWPKFFRKMCYSVETSSRSVPRSEKVAFSVSNYHHFIYGQNISGSVKCSTVINGFIHHTFKLRIPTTEPVVLPTAHSYTEGIVPINTKKIKDIKKCVEYVPDHIREDFWDEILAWPTCDNEDNDPQQ